MLLEWVYRDSEVGAHMREPQNLLCTQSQEEVKQAKGGGAPPLNSRLALL